MPADPGGLDYHRVLLSVFALAIGGALVVAAGTSTASFGLYNDRWNGATELQAIGDDVGTEVVVIRNVSGYAEPSNATLGVIIAPNASYTARELDRLSGFVHAGGTLLVAEDFGEHSTPILRAIGAAARLDGRLLRDERYNYRSPAMPIARNLSSHPVTRGLDGLTVNHGTAVEPNGATVLISSSEYAYLDGNRNGAPDQEETVGSYPVLTLERVGEGRVLVLSDPSVLINVMLDRPGNRAFVENLFAPYSTVLLDYTHGAEIPLLAQGVLVVRRSVAVQILLGIGGVLLIAGWGRGDVAWLVDRLPSRSGRPARHDAELDEAGLVALFTRRYPEWDEPRVRRVVRGIITRRREDGRND